MRKTFQRLLILLLAGMALPGSSVFAASQNEILQKEPIRSYGAIDVILYETAWCPYCTKARKLLRDMGVSLIEYDVEKDEAKRAEMLAKSRGSRGVPVIDVEGIILRGYSPEAIRTAVEKQRRR